MQQQIQIRPANKAGTWYSHEPSVLQNELDGWLENTQNQETDIKQVKAIIGPHAGLRYCGQVGAWGYQHLRPQKDLRVFLLGPSHYHSMNGCGLSSFQQFETPLGNIQVDTQTIQEIYQNQDKYCQENNLQQKIFQYITKQVDEKEHSLELHISWIQHMLQQQQFKLIPIMIGFVDYSDQEHIGKFLQQYFDDENTVFVISSDFAHWGERFRYTIYDQSKGKIHQSIEHFDKLGMSIIETHDPDKFDKYLNDTKNTICGRKPIGILLQTIQNSTNKNKLITKFLAYDQSSKCIDYSDSSVSYASSITYISK